MDVLEKVLNLIYPPVCGFCNDINEKFLCTKCERKFNELKISNVEYYQNVPVYFDEHYYFLKYENEVRDFIIQYKFQEKSYLYKSFAKLIAEDDIFKNEFIKKYDCVISVPIHKKRYKTRGYNQSKLIAKEVAKLSDKKYYDNVIIKNKNIVAQSTLDVLGRVSNIKGAFSEGTNANLVKGQNVIVFDDIFTTGSTVNECAKVLKEIGASYVGIATLAKD
ncbi:MAG: ComF family protein [Clostridia bacterium]|nr:ComF family protein [Clostridia bacterium]